MTTTCSTSISNNKIVPVTCVIVDAMPRSTDEVIKVNTAKLYIVWNKIMPTSGQPISVFPWQAWNFGEGEKLVRVHG